MPNLMKNNDIRNIISEITSHKILGRYFRCLNHSPISLSYTVPLSQFSYHLRHLLLWYCGKFIAWPALRKHHIYLLFVIWQSIFVIQYNFAYLLLIFKLQFLRSFVQSDKMSICLAFTKHAYGYLAIHFYRNTQLFQVM